MTRSILDGLPWSAVTAVGIRTTADGPFDEDVFWQLIFRAGAGDGGREGEGSREGGGGREGEGSREGGGGRDSDGCRAGRAGDGGRGRDGDRDGGCGRMIEIPGALIDEVALRTLGEHLPGLDWRQVTRAMGSTDERVFSLWDVGSPRRAAGEDALRGRFIALIARLRGNAQSGHAFEGVGGNPPGGDGFAGGVGDPRGGDGFAGGVGDPRGGDGFAGVSDDPKVGDALERGGAGAGEAFDRLRAAWGGEQRRYHDVRHLEACLDELGGVAVEAATADAIELALWYHDAVYEPGAGDCESRSAALLLRESATLAIPAETARRAADLVLATAHVHAPVARGDRATDLIVDIDLSILGRDPLAFMDYEHSVEEEYAAVPTAVFRAARGRFLGSLLAAPAIFRTSSFAARYEERARSQIRALLDGPRYRRYLKRRWWQCCG